MYPGGRYTVFLFSYTITGEEFPVPPERRSNYDVPLCDNLRRIKEVTGKGDCAAGGCERTGSYRKGHIPGAVSVPYSEELSFQEKFLKTETIVFCCDRGNLSTRVTLRMRKAGYQAYSLAGGYEGYRRFQK